LLGVFLKTHGIEGNMIVKLSLITEDELTEGEPVFVEIDGIPVPFFVSSFRFISGDAAILKLDEIDTSDEASGFVNRRILIEAKEPDDKNDLDDKGYNKLKGFRVVDEKFGESGILQEIFEIPENPVMRIDLEGRELLVPFHSKIVRNIDYEARLIEISAPEGLLDLYL
jgi:16S rRNA processing protein RimM